MTPSATNVVVFLLGSGDTISHKCGFPTRVRWHISHKCGGFPTRVRWHHQPQIENPRSPHEMCSFYSTGLSEERNCIFTAKQCHLSLILFCFTLTFCPQPFFFFPFLDMGLNKQRLDRIVAEMDSTVVRSWWSSDRCFLHTWSPPTDGRGWDGPLHVQLVSPCALSSRWSRETARACLKKSKSAWDGIN